MSALDTPSYGAFPVLRIKYQPDVILMPQLKYCNALPYVAISHSTTPYDHLNTNATMLTYMHV